MRTVGQPTREICKGRAQHQREQDQKLRLELSTWKSMTHRQAQFSALQGHLSVEEVNDNADKYVECHGAAHGDHSLYVNVTRILFTLSFIIAIVCFVFGCAAYANRERRVWYRTLGQYLTLVGDKRQITVGCQV